MRTWTAESAATPEAAWALLAEPDAWSSWAPHVRGAWGLGSPEVRDGAIGAARLLGVVLVPATITEKAEDSWTWRVGPAEMVHRVERLARLRVNSGRGARPAPMTTVPEHAVLVLAHARALHVRSAR